MDISPECESFEHLSASADKQIGPIFFIEKIGPILCANSGSRR